MDSFTQNILVRARERQRLLAEFTVSEELELEPVAENLPRISEIVNKFSKGVTENSPETVKNTSSHACTDSTDSAVSVNVSKADEGNLYHRNSPQSTKTLFISNCQNVTPLHSKSLNIKRDDFDMEITLKSSSENVQLQIEIEETDCSPRSNICGQLENKAESGKEVEEKTKPIGFDEVNNSSGATTKSNSQINQKDSSSFSVSSSLSSQKRQSDTSQENKENVRQRKGLKCLADLAQNINQWEDEIKIPRKSSPKKTTQKRSTKPPAPKPPVTNNTDTKKAVNFNGCNAPAKINTAREPECNNDSQKQFQLDKNLFETLESQGFTRTTSNSHLVYNYKSRDNKEDKGATGHTSNIIQKEKDNKMAENLNPNMKRIITGTPGSPSKGKAPFIADKAQIFETPSPSKSTKDPALLSVSERRALFEKNKEVVIPKAPLGMPVPVHSQKNNASNVKSQTRKSPLKKYPAPKRPDEAVTTSAPTIQTNVPITSNSKVTNSQSELESAAAKSTVVTGPQASGIASKTAALLQGKSTISQSTIESSIRQERQKEMDMLLNRFNKNKAKQTPPAIMEESDEDNCSEKTPMIDSKSNKIECLPASTSSPLSPSGQSRHNPSRNKSVSPKVAAVLEDVKRIKVSPVKAGRLYPSLSDIEATPTETENEDNEPIGSHNNSSSEESSFGSGSANNSFRKEVIQAVIKNHSSQKRSINDDGDIDTADDTDEGSSNISSSFTDDNVRCGPTPPKLSRASEQLDKHPQISNSFHYKNCSINQDTTPTVVTTANEMSRRKSTDLPSYVIDDGNVLPLQHTLSFYRRQQSQETKTTPKHVSKQTVSLTRVEEDESSEIDLVEEKMQSLQEEINKQQLMISQTSQAINLCSSTMEFMGSTEQVEAERVLLLATHKRQAVLNELQRLSVEKTLVPLGKNSRNGSGDKGTVTIANITLPLKREYVRALVAAGGMGHHIVCLIKCCEQVIATKLVSTVATSNKTPDFEVKIPGKYTLNGIYAECAITFEVYCLQAQEEMLPHEIKYHINKKSTSKLTPKKSKQESRLIRPMNESPAGPNAVRSPTFALMGYVVLQVQSASKKHWSLNNVPPKSPLEGTAELYITYQPDLRVEHEGFLTVFEDISGFGAWHRRWYLLKGHALSYWKYPDDEKKMPPIDTIDLRNCITKEVGPVSRDICARLNTFLVEIERPAQPHDKDSLVTICQGDKTIIRHLFSADTKEERIEWCKNLNAALKVTRATKE